MSSHLKFIDSHAHLSDASVFPKIDVIIERARQANVDTIINICTDISTLESGLELNQRYPFIFNVAATTPHDVLKEGEIVFPIIEKYARTGALVAIGETGLDYFHHHSPKEMQQDFLSRYLRLALDCHLPVVIHCREAFTDFFKILDHDYLSEKTHLPGVLHCFTGTESEAAGVLDRGWYVSLSGIVTFKKSESLRAVAKMVPLNRLLIETDTPYLAPQKYRGEINQPAFVVETAKVIAEIKGISLETLASATTDNARRVFSLSDSR